MLLLLQKENVIPGDPRYDPEARRKKIAALKVTNEFVCCWMSYRIGGGGGGGGERDSVTSIAFILVNYHTYIHGYYLLVAV